MFYLFIKFPVLEKLCVRHFLHDIPVSGTQFIFLHDYQIAIRNYFHYFHVRQM